VVVIGTSTAIDAFLPPAGPAQVSQRSTETDPVGSKTGVIAVSPGIVRAAHETVRCRPTLAGAMSHWGDGLRARLEPVAVSGNRRPQDSVIAADPASL
jgi:hypothetical protein